MHCAITKWGPARVGLLVFTAVISRTAPAVAALPNPWIVSDATPYGQPIPNTWSIETFHADPAFAGLPPKAFCRKVFDIYYDGRRKNYGDSTVGLTLWAHSPQEPLANPGLVEADPILLLNVHGSAYCLVASMLLEGIYQSRPGGAPGKPAIDARGWSLAGIVHAVCEAFYDGRWHYFDIDLGGYAGDEERDVWSVVDVLADPKGYYGERTTFKSAFFFEADRRGAWVEKIDPTKSFLYQDCHILGHEMSFSLRPGERLVRYFSRRAAGWAELAPPTKNADENTKGFCEMIYEPAGPGQAAAAALWQEGPVAVFAVRCPYNITSSRVEASGTVRYSTDLGQTWKPLASDSSVPEVVNHWDYLVRVEGGALRRIVTRGMLHPGALPRVDRRPTTMTVRSMADYDVLTWIPDWSTEEAFAAHTRVEGNLRWSAEQAVAFSGGKIAGTGTMTIRVPAPPGGRIVKLSACAIAGIGTVPDPNKCVELHLGPAGDPRLVARSTDCSAWGRNPETRVAHWQSNVSGWVRFPPASEAEVRIVCRGWAMVRGVRIAVGYVREKPLPPSGVLTVVHGYDGKTFSRDFPVREVLAGPVAYTTPEGAMQNEFVLLAVREDAAVKEAPVSGAPPTGQSAAPDAPSEKPTASRPDEVSVRTEDWDWVTAMRAVARRGRKRNREGVVLSLGDSLTYANPSTRWAMTRTGATPDDRAILDWSHAGRQDDRDGWWLARVDRPGGRSETAAGGVRVDEYLLGGKGGLPPLTEILERYRPQVVFVLLGANDVTARRTPEAVTSDMRKLLEAVLACGTIPVLQLLAPRGDPQHDELTRRVNEQYLALAKEMKIPIVDLYGEFVSRAPNGAWKTQLLYDGVHFTHELSGGPPTQENLARCGYLLRCWLAVQKLKDIRAQVLEATRE